MPSWGPFPPMDDIAPFPPTSEYSSRPSRKGLPPIRVRYTPAHFVPVMDIPSPSIQPSQQQHAAMTQALLSQITTQNDAWNVAQLKKNVTVQTQQTNNTTVDNKENEMSDVLRPPSISATSEYEKFYKPRKQNNKRKKHRKPDHYRQSASENRNVIRPHPDQHRPTEHRPAFQGSSQFLHMFPRLRDTVTTTMAPVVTTNLPFPAIIIKTESIAQPQNQIKYFEFPSEVMNFPNMQGFLNNNNFGQNSGKFVPEVETTFPVESTYPIPEEFSRPPETPKNEWIPIKPPQAPIIKHYHVESSMTANQQNQLNIQHMLNQNPIQIEVTNQPNQYNLQPPPTPPPRPTTQTQFHNTGRPITQSQVQNQIRPTTQVQVQNSVSLYEGSSLEYPYSSDQPIYQSDFAKPTEQFIEVPEDPAPNVQQPAYQEMKPGVSYVNPQPGKIISQQTFSFNNAEPSVQYVEHPQTHSFQPPDQGKSQVYTISHTKPSELEHSKHQYNTKPPAQSSNVYFEPQKTSHNNHRPVSNEKPHKHRQINVHFEAQKIPPQHYDAEKMPQHRPTHGQFHKTMMHHQPGKMQQHYQSQPSKTQQYPYGRTEQLYQQTPTNYQPQQQPGDTEQYYQNPPSNYQSEQPEKTEQYYQQPPTNYQSQDDNVEENLPGKAEQYYQAPPTNYQPQQASKDEQYYQPQQASKDEQYYKAEPANPTAATYTQTSTETPAQAAQAIEAFNAEYFLQIQPTQSPPQQTPQMNSKQDDMPSNNSSDTEVKPTRRSATVDKDESPRHGRAWYHSKNSELPEAEYVEPEYDFNANDIPIALRLTDDKGAAPEVTTSTARVLVQQSERERKIADVKRQSPASSPVIVYAEKPEDSLLTPTTLSGKRLSKSAETKKSVERTEVEILPSQGHMLSQEVVHYHSPVRSDGYFY
ncbi:hypothetical protein B566_EDAN013089 [Ephemera danica]|nr:hypothetical protein B566_EDAN013089 [Ephemera danica]